MLGDGLLREYLGPKAGKSFRLSRKLARPKVEMHAVLDVGQIAGTDSTSSW